MAGNTAVKRVIRMARRNRATANITETKVLVRVRTDFEKPIRDERVLLVRPDGRTHETRTDENGLARFQPLTLPPGVLCYLVLPDILETWAFDPPREWHADDKRHLVVDRHHDQGFCDEYGDVTRFRDQNKDYFDKMEKVAAKDADDKALKKINANHAKRADYRKRDLTKYGVFGSPLATADDDVAYTLTVNRLTAEEKFEHLRETFEDNKAVYYPGRNGYDDDQRVWNVSSGCVCNQFANFFLGYWFNYNGAATPRASSTDFLRMMENDASKAKGNAIYPYRGFSDVVGDGLRAPEGTDEKIWRSRRVHRDGSSGSFPYVRIDDEFLVNSGFSFADTSRLKFSSADFEKELAAFNVYSVTDGKDKLIYDHHGGIMIKTKHDMILTLAADGYKKSDGNYSKTEIKLKTPANLKKAAKNKNLHLRIWPLEELRKGGYAPGKADGQYMAETDVAALDNIEPHYRHALSRFIVWTGRSS